MRLTSPQKQLLKEADVDLRRQERAVQTADTPAQERAILNLVRSNQYDRAFNILVNHYRGESHDELLQYIIQPLLMNKQYDQVRNIFNYYPEESREKLLQQHVIQPLLITGELFNSDIWSDNNWLEAIEAALMNLIGENIGDIWGGGSRVAMYHNWLLYKMQNAPKVYSDAIANKLWQLAAQRDTTPNTRLAEIYELGVSAIINDDDKDEFIKIMENIDEEAYDSLSLQSLADGLETQHNEQPAALMRPAFCLLIGLNARCEGWAENEQMIKPIHSAVMDELA